MAGRPDPHVLVDEIERLIQVDVGRNITGLFDAARGGLWGAASALATARSARVGLITGFYVPQGSPPAAETDGPLGTALLAKGLLAVGIPCRVATDEPCARRLRSRTSQRRSSPMSRPMLSRWAPLLFR